VLSICAGDGRDVLPVLSRWRRRKEISGRLIELEPLLAERAQAAAKRERLEAIDVLCADAARPASYAAAIPADLVVACGVFGNVADADVKRVVDAFGTLCAEHGNVIWTRHRRSPDLTPTIREWFGANGFEERAFHSPGPEQFAVGQHELAGRRARGVLHDPLFTFVR
jgi:hypothetical protein